MMVMMMMVMMMMMMMTTTTTTTTMMMMMMMMFIFVVSAGDYTTNANNAEIQGGPSNNEFQAFGRNKRPGESWGLLHSVSKFVGVTPYSTLRLNVKDELVEANNGHGFVHINSYKV
jgi:hypothetical protein